MKELEKQLLRMMNGLGLKSELKTEQYVCNVCETKPVTLHGATIFGSITKFQDGNLRVEVHFVLPEESVLAQTFMDACAKIENTPKNHHYHYCTGSKYRDYGSEMFAKMTEAFSPWNNRFFIVESSYYPLSEIQMAVDNTITLARQFVSHLDLLKTLRFWKTTDKEVLAKAQEIIKNADLHETDVDREERAHWLEDRNSFIRGWFYPFVDRERGSFDTNIYGVEFAAKGMGVEGSFEFAVACIVLLDRDYIAKARKACIIRKKRIRIRY